MAHEENQQKLFKETLCHKRVLYSMATIPLCSQTTPCGQSYGTDFGVWKSKIIELHMTDILSLKTVRKPPPRGTLHSLVLRISGIHHTLRSFQFDLGHFPCLSLLCPSMWK